jgi:hypothetical protein
MNNKRNVVALNIALLGCAAWMAWTFYQGWTAGDGAAGTPAAAGDAPQDRYSLPPERLLTASGSQVIQRNPFSADRNILAEEAAAAPAGPPPQLPVVIGTMRLRDRYEALMAENAQNAGTSFKQVKVGDAFAGFTVAEIRDDEVVVELNGQKSIINVYLSSSSVVRNTGRTSVEAAPAAAAPRVESASAQPSVNAAAAASAAAGVQLPSPDPLLKITIEGNRKRYERTTMFGPQIWYEDLK